MEGEAPENEDQEQKRCQRNKLFGGEIWGNFRGIGEHQKYFFLGTTISNEVHGKLLNGKTFS